MATTSNNTKSINTIEPQENDIRAGRGNASNRHPGNKYFRSIVEPYKTRYAATTTSLVEKKDIIIKITQQIESLNPPGRFLKKDPKTGLWSVMNKKQKERKTAQALREKQRKDDDEDDDNDREEGEPFIVRGNTALHPNLGDNSNFGESVAESNDNNIIHGDNNSCASNDTTEVAVGPKQQDYMKTSHTGINKPGKVLRHRSLSWDELVTTDNYDSSTNECHEESMVDLMASVKSMELEISNYDMMDVSQNICGYLGLNEKATTGIHHERRQTYPVVMPGSAISNESFNNLRHSAPPYYQQEEDIKDAPTVASSQQSFHSPAFNNKNDAASSTYPPVPFEDTNIDKNTTFNTVDADASSQQKQNLPTQSSHSFYNDHNNRHCTSTFIDVEDVAPSSVCRRQTFPMTPSDYNFNPDIFFSEKENNNNTSQSSLQLSDYNNLAKVLLCDDRFTDSMSFNESVAKIDFGLDSMASISYGNIDECFDGNQHVLIDN